MSYKKNSGICPIAVGCTFRRLVSNFGCRRISEKLADYLKHIQLGIGVDSGCEAAVYATTACFANDSSDEIVLLKVDIKNAWHAVERSVLLYNVKDIIS